MTSGMEFCLLGPLTVRAEGVAMPIPAGKQRALLTALLLNAGRTVTADQLADLLWGPALPPSAAMTLQNYVKRLRQALGAGRYRIMTQPGGYLIQVHRGELDLSAMEEALTTAHRAAQAGAWTVACERAVAALAFWRGEPFCDVDLGEMAVQEIPRLTEMRLRARELRIEASLHLGGHSEIVAEALQLTLDAPLREPVHALLMQALYRCGRRAEALEAYQHARDVLIKELGSEPGPELQALHRQLLDDDPALTLTQPDSAPGGGEQKVLAPGEPGPAQVVSRGLPAPAVVPRQLPAAVAGFTGRDHELARLTSLLGQEPDGRAPAMVISAIGGTAGVGKTALAVHWAHQVAARFPDGQLYINLRGYDPRSPVAPADALAGFLQALGVPGQQIPVGADDRAGLYRSRLAGRRVLVILDNARDAGQVRPLLPGDPGCFAVVTSRDVLAGLVAADGAQRIDLDVLPPAEAVGLLRSLIGSRADDDLEAAEELATLCARLPLALRIAAELAVSRPDAALTELTAELAASRLDCLDAGDDRTDVRAVFSWSVRQLPEDVARPFALAGLHPGEDLDVYAAAALDGISTAQARRVLGRLQRASLLQEAGGGRYGMHDLLRAYAREQAAARDGGGSCHQALTCLFDYYLAAAGAAMDVVFPAEAHHRPRVATVAAVLPELPGPAEARGWLDRERANLVAVIVHCAQQGWPEHTAGLAGILARYLISGSHLAEAEIVYGHALEAARRSGDLAAEASALHGLGNTAGMTGRSRDAVGHFQTAVESYRQCGDRAGEARVLHNLGVIEARLRNHHAAAAYDREALAAYEDAGDRLGAAGALCSLAGPEIELGSLDRASEYLQRALAVFRAEKDQLREAQALSWMGDVGLRRGQLTGAADYFEQSMALYRDVDYPDGIADGLYNLGEVSLRQARFAEAIAYQRQALALHRKNGYLHGEARTLRSLAAALDATGHHAAARAELETAIRLATEAGSTYEHASAESDLAASHHRAGEAERARHHWQLALDLYIRLGAPEADEVQARLEKLQAAVG
jgi:DNA-binding SARP family transcriptional activator/tetratricopeptide (TPR) repeat protein